VQKQKVYYVAQSYLLNLVAFCGWIAKYALHFTLTMCPSSTAYCLNSQIIDASLAMKSKILQIENRGK